MSGARLISTRLTVCVACGHESRLVASTSDEVISRCYACGDLSRTPHQIPPAWSAEAGIVRHRQRVADAGPAEPLRPEAKHRGAAHAGEVPTVFRARAAGGGDRRIRRAGHRRLGDDPDRRHLWLSTRVIRL